MQPAGSPDSRTRSIWLTQLVLAAGVVLICLLVLVLEPRLYAGWAFATGMAILVVVTAATLAVPWARVPKVAVLAVPFIDAVAIGFVASETDLRLGYLWVFPVVWVATRFRAIPLIALLSVIGLLLLIDAMARPSSSATLRVIVVLLSLVFLAITTYLASREGRALQRLMVRQAGRLSKTADRRLDQERRTTEIINGIDTGVARISSNGTVLAVNDYYLRLYGLDPLDTSLPAQSAEYISQRGMPVPSIDRPFARAARGEIFSDVRVWLYTPGGSWRALSASAKRLSATDADEASVLLLVQDITAITYAERERERLAAIASHELKHPLTAMIGNTELALESEDLSPKMRQRLETILQATDRMLELMTSSGKGSTNAAARDTFAEVDLRDIISDSIASFTPTARAHEVDVQVAAHVPLPVYADAFRLRQVVDNLISNAIKYTPSQGSVLVTAAQDADEAVLIVADTGIGISKDDQPKLMTPYFRTDNAKQKASGTGLGLGISREIVTAHQGTLSIESEVEGESDRGSGTTVTVRLPRCEQLDTALSGGGR